MHSLIDYSTTDTLALIGLARAPVNALGHALRRELQQALREAQDDPAVKAIVIHGRDLPFSAGADVSEFGSPAFTAEPGLG